MGRVTAKLLREIPLFRHLDASVLGAIAPLARLRAYGPRQVIVEQDCPAHAIYLIKRGRAEVAVVTRDGRGSTLGELGPGEIIGEISLLDGGACSATVTTVSAAELLCIDRPLFMDLLGRSPALAVALLAVVAGRLRRLTRWADDVAGLSLAPRLAKCVMALLSEYGQQTGPSRFRIGLRISQSDLATRVGASRESVNKHLRRWQRQQILTHEAGHLVVMDVQRLRVAAAGD